MYFCIPLVYFAMNLMIVPGILVCSSFLISVCIFIVSKALFISSATVIVCEGGAILLNTFANLCSAVTVVCCVLYPCYVGVFGMFAVNNNNNCPISNKFSGL